MPTSVEIHVHIPIVWKVGAPPATMDSVLLLRVLALLEAAPPHLDEDESVESLRWQALEARVDLCVQMLAQLLSRGEQGAEMCNANLSGEGCTWQSPIQQTVGERGALAMNLSPQIPQALWLPATITSCAQDGERWAVTARFDIVDAEMQDWLDKTIFRHHRREISELRRHAHDTDPNT